MYLGWICEFDATMAATASAGICERNASAAPRLLPRRLPQPLLFVMMTLMVLLLLAPTPARAWDDEDIEIFDLQDALRRIDKTADFYSVLEVPRNAEIAEINRAYRRKSLAYHPDKTLDVRLRKLHTLLTSITTILKDDDKRQRYNGHLTRGFPTWRGTDYYYNRYKPGLLVALVFVLTVVSIAQYIIAWVFYFRRKSEVVEEMDALNQLTYAQLRKNLQKKLTVPNASGSQQPLAQMSKRAMKKATPIELLQASGELAPDAFDVPVPSVTNVAIVALPIFIGRQISFMVRRFRKDGKDDDGSSAPDQKNSADESVSSASGNAINSSWVDIAKRRNKKSRMVSSSSQESFDQDM